MTDAPSVRKRLNRLPDPQLQDRIRRLWIRHSIAEARRDVDGLIATLAPDCVYRIDATAQRWEGHAGARRFYAEFLGAFPDVGFELVDIVIGPQGVIEVASMTGTHRGEWASMPPSGREVRLTVVIHFPWDEASGLFGGERIYLDRAAFRS
jgi:predicted ester cyclase